MVRRVGVLVGVALVAAACSGSSSGGGQGGGDPVPLVGATEQGMRVRIDVVGDREVHVRIPVDCENDEESDETPRGSQEVPLERLVPDVAVDDDGWFRIDDTIVEDGTDGDELHVDLVLQGRFAADGTASGTVEATQRQWNGQDEGFRAGPCATGEIGWTADEPARPPEPVVTGPLGADAMTTAPLGDGVVVVFETGEVVRVDAAGEARHLDGSPIDPPADDPSDLGEPGTVAPAVAPPPFTDAAVAGEGVWLRSFSGVDRLEVAGGAASTRIGGNFDGIEAGPGALWIVSSRAPDVNRTLERRDPVTGEVQASLPVMVGQLLVDPTGVWYAYSTWQEQALDRIDPATATVVDHHVLDAGETPSELAVAGDRVWLHYDGIGRSLVALDPSTGVTTPVELPTHPDTVTAAADGATLWTVHVREAVARRLDAEGDVVEIVDLPDGWWEPTATPGALWLTGRDTEGVAQVLRLPV